MRNCASTFRKEDDRFLGGRGQHLDHFFMAGRREVAFFRSPVAYAPLKDSQSRKNFATISSSSSMQAACRNHSRRPPHVGGNATTFPLLIEIFTRAPIGQRIMISCPAKRTSSRPDMQSADSRYKSTWPPW